MHKLLAMPFYQFILLIPLITLLDSANVLVISGLRGTHLYITTEVAGNDGLWHNVTVLTAANEDPRVDFKFSDRNFRFATYADDLLPPRDLIIPFRSSTPISSLRINTLNL